MTSSNPAPDRFPWGLVVSLSLAQLVSWGTIFYAFTLFMEPMTRELGWSKPELSAAYSLGLVAWGLGAVPVGRLIDLGYGRSVMTGGSILATILFLMWSGVESYPVFIALWIGLGFAMSAVLYEPGFAILTRSVGPLARRAITAMTFLGGLASTVFIPLTHVLIEGLGWRMALVALAGINLAVCGAIHAGVIPSEKGRKDSGPAAAGPARGDARRVLKSAAFWGFVATAVLHGALFTGFSVHLIPLLVERGFSLEVAVAAFSLIGPAQVMARVVIAVGERRLSMRGIGLVTLALPVAAFALLAFVRPGSGLGMVAVFAALYGAANGLMTVVRAVLPSEIFGRADYGAIQGMIAAPATFSKAVGPFLFGLVWAWSGGYDAVVALGFALALTALICFVATVYFARTDASPG